MAFDKIALDEMAFDEAVVDETASNGISGPSLAQLSFCSGIAILLYIILRGAGWFNILLRCIYSVLEFMSTKKQSLSQTS